VHHLLVKIEHCEIVLSNHCCVRKNFILWFGVSVAQFVGKCFSENRKYYVLSFFQNIVIHLDAVIILHSADYQGETAGCRWLAVTKCAFTSNFNQ